jgi:hypothetical protein
MYLFWFNLKNIGLRLDRNYSLTLSEVAIGITLQSHHMEQDKKKEPEKKKENTKDKTKNWIDKAEEYIDETSEKIHKSDTYRKVDQSMEKATKSIFRKAGKLWGKSERFLKNSKKDNKDD